MGLTFPRTGRAGQWSATLLAVVGSAFGLTGVGWYWATGESVPFAYKWALIEAEFSVAIDGLSALFLAPIFLISLLGNVYGLGYWKQSEHLQNGRKLRLFYGTMTAGMALLVIARNSIVFLFGWEIMALSAFFLVSTEDHLPEVRQTGWIYLVATHSATLCLFAMFALLRIGKGSFELTSLAPNSLTPGMANAVFVLALLGFGLKAGLMPLHVWLPDSHAIAPSHVSAVMSGVIIKMGIYGLMRVTAMLPNPPLAWGVTVLILGVVSGVLGVAFAVGQHDLKRLLAYHSIENIGIIVIGLGLALIGRSLGRFDLVILGLSGSLLHVWNHALFKSLLFLSAGSVIHSAETREIDHLGGLAKTMPWTSACFVIGAVAICGLPPLNGFVSEFLIYVGLFRTLIRDAGPTFAPAAFAVPALALIGALAVACFVKVFGAVFLGTARSAYARHGHESPPTMLGPMIVLAGCCFIIGLVPFLVQPLLGQGIEAWVAKDQFATVRSDDLALVPTSKLAPLEWITPMGLALVSALLVISLALRFLLRKNGLERGPTWGCGYTAPNTRMQYTSSSFAQMLVSLFAWALRPRVRRPANLTLFPQRAEFHSEVPDTVLDRAVLPSFHFVARFFSRLRFLQQGNIQIYLVYIFLALLALLLWR
jgi:hydrogenase-4 component B